MPLVSNLFFLFTALAVLVYYLAPRKAQWVVLLLFSYIYYVTGGVRFVVYILFSTAVTYTCARLIDRLWEKETDQQTVKRVVAVGLILNFGMLGYVKYANFFIENANSLFHIQIPVLKVLFPLGISFYTFQSSGYLLDVFWKKFHAEKNFFKYALFVSFFPQIMQGPISKYDHLAHQLYDSHSFDLQRICRGVERIIWGLCKKMIIADWAGVFADAISQDPGKYNGVVGLGLLLYYINLYMDFSGAMDIVIGIGSLFGIEMQENFRNPYLATSLANLWKRWHITLGEWMMRYVFYPVSLTTPVQKITKATKKKFGRKAARNIQVAQAELVVFLLVGIWHGASWISVAYGFSNGIIIAVSEVLTDSYAVWKKKLHIKGTEKWYVLFMILRTQLIFCLESVLDMARSVPQAGYLLMLAFTRFNPSQLLQVPAGSQGVSFAPWALLIIAVGTIVVITVGCIQEKGVKIRESLAAKLPFPAVCAVYAVLLLCIGLFGCTAAAKGFIYAQF
ncbi:MAG: MBOAT family protein [Blautia sp.]|nr:MBOAT family protein [Blautia sp.]